MNLKKSNNSQKLDNFRKVRQMDELKALDKR